MTPHERLAKALEVKDEGAKEFTSGNFTVAVDLYQKAAELVEGEEEGEEMADDETDVYVKCYGNAAMCYIKCKDWWEVIRCCNTVFKACPGEEKTNIKLLYRRGLAKMRVGELKDAKADLMAAYRIDSKNADVRKAIQELKTKSAEMKKKEKAAFRGIFGKVSMYDDKEGPLVPNAKAPNRTNDESILLPTISFSLAAIVRIRQESTCQQYALVHERPPRGWWLPGGGVEHKDHTPVHAAIRETVE